MFLLLLLLLLLLYNLKLDLKKSLSYMGLSSYYMLEFYSIQETRKGKHCESIYPACCIFILYFTVSNTFFFFFLFFLGGGSEWSLVTCSPRDTVLVVLNSAGVDGLFQDVEILSKCPPGVTSNRGLRV